MKNKRFFLAKDVLSTIAVSVPDKKMFSDEYEVTMRDCSRQIHWLFPNNRKGLAKARKVAKFFNELVASLESKVGNK
jgi:predicted P-loop ATPase/GTPase